MQAQPDRQSQQQVIASLPHHLQPFVALQDYSLYTPRDHAVWRFLLQQLRTKLSTTAVPVYLQGLQKTGISLDAIPRIEDINQSLNNLGWRAVVVDGFVPPAIFMEFQALRVLAVAVNMRSIEHMLYTPAPDIVHESAGHAPFLVDVDYAEFLQSFGELGMRAVASRDDIDIYEAVRAVSIVKELSNASTKDIEAAQQQLNLALEKNTTPSEMSLLSRLHWWTVEYGLVGELDDYRIFGAGLLSSLGESSHCLDDKKVKKRPLTVDAIETAYDITREQPQLFVTKNCRHLSQVLGEFGKQMCCSRGGLSSIEQAITSGCVNTAELDNKVQISGVFKRVLSDAVGNVSYLQFKGPTQLSYAGQQLEGQGTDYHDAGYGTAIGPLRGMERCLSSYSVDELAHHGISLEKLIELNFLSGIQLEGRLIGLVRQEQKNIIFRFADCRVTSGKGEALFLPEWGIYDMAVGDSVSSVFGGSADPAHYPLYSSPSNKATQTDLYNNEQRYIFQCYQDLRQWRQGPPPHVIEFESWLQMIEQKMASLDQASQANNWLLYFEALELSLNNQYPKTLIKRLINTLNNHRAHNRDIDQLVDLGFKSLGLTYINNTKPYDLELHNEKREQRNGGLYNEVRDDGERS